MRRVLLAVAIAVGAAACGGRDGNGDTVVIQQLSADVLPSKLLGLNVELEDVAARVEGVERSYIESTGLFSLRDGDELKATLQISTFNDEAKIDRKFRLAVVDQIGATKPRSFRMGDDTVYLTSSKRQGVAIFFRPRSFVVLSTLDTFDQGRSLLREILELDL
jgi:hypothetical protein